jgi:hypothetical protein
MNAKSILPILSAFIFLHSCGTINTAGYFNLPENQVEHYTGYFASIHGDSVIDTTHIIYQATDIDGYKAFYAIETKDTLEYDPSIGSRHFLFSSLIFYNDTVFIAPVYWKSGLNKLRFTDFRYKIPPRLAKKESITIIDGEKKMRSQGFSHTTLTTNNKKYEDCLTFTIKEIWPGKTYTGKVWLHKKYGLLKWIRSTGRVDTRML